MMEERTFTLEKFNEHMKKDVILRSDNEFAMYDPAKLPM